MRTEEMTPLMQMFVLSKLLTVAVCAVLRSA